MTETPPSVDAASLVQLLDEKAEPVLHRELQYTGLLPERASYTARLLALALT